MKTWIFLRNPFLNATCDSFINALEISSFHDNALAAAKSDPFFLAMYNLYHPLHTSFKTAYDAWKSQGGKEQGKTLNIKQLLGQLAHTKIREWDIKIQNLYDPHTPEYKELLPNHRQPFQKGKQIKRIHAVQALINSIDSNEVLATLKADIVSFYNLLDTAYTTQKENKKLLYPYERRT